MRVSTSVRAVSAASLVFLLAGDRASAGTCAAGINNPPPLACASAASSLAESVLNPPVGEDTSFFANTASSVPTVVFVLDTSANMRRLAIDVTGDAVRMAGTGCSNTILNRLKYRANPCRNGLNQVIPTATMTAAGATSCSGGTLPGSPKGWNLVYNPANAYPPFEVETDPALGLGTANTDLFQGSRYYLLDRGWSKNATTVQAPDVYPTPGASCAAAGLASGSPEYAACSACLDGAADALNPNRGGGYWLHPTDPSIAVFRGSWLNFFPPKYVAARRVLREQVYAMDNASNATSRQAVAILATDLDSPAGRFGCYGPVNDPALPTSYNPTANGTGMWDAWHDGARFLDASATLWPACSGNSCTPNRGPTSRTALYASFYAPWLFGSPTGSVAGASDLFSSGDATGCPAVAGVKWTTGPDGVCKGTYQALFTGGGVPSPFPPSLDGRPAVCAPYAEALFNVGQYFSTSNLYATLWGPGWQKKPPTPSVLDFDERMGSNASVCPPGGCACPQLAAILVTGGSPQFDDNLPPALTGGPACGLSGTTSNIVKVAQALASTNLRTDGFPAKVTLQTFIVDFGSADGSLAAAARAGRGAYLPAADAKDLRSALNDVLQNIRTRLLSFSNVTLSAVQTVTSQGVLVPRFMPQPGALWDGHLYKFKLFSELACGCPNKAGCDLNGDGTCDGVYFTDADGSVVVETASGEFQKTSLVGSAFVANGAPARPIWDAGAALSTRPADSRKIMTVVDSNGDNLLDARDQVIEFSRANACLLAPYLNVAGSDFCNSLNAQYNACLTVEECAGTLIDFVRGKDVFNATCTAGFDRRTPPDRPNKLGDIFHSSPAVVDPPARSGSAVGQLGLLSQYVMSIEATGTKQAIDPSTGATAYAQYALAQAHRDKVALVGTNDGMLHAFQNGRWIAGKNPGAAYDTCPAPPGNCPGYYDDGTGEELWAFIPPDLLPKLVNLVGATHQYFVDGSAMVRDVWADAAAPTFVKTPDEFHTVAVIGERRGGSSFFALDVTDPHGPATLPSAGFFRWTYPQPTSTDVGRTGATYADFLPTPPPIGPVRLKNAASPYLYQGTAFEERWIVLLNGGHDPTLQQRGNGLFMLDVWRGGNGTDPATPIWSAWGDLGPTGAPVIRYTSGGVGTTAPGQMQFSFAATPGLVAFGPTTKAPANDLTNGYFFDTATVGDVGGQLWSARFNNADPATWAVARVMTVSDTGTTGSTINSCARQPFFHITANVLSSRDGYTLHTALGSGDRFNLRDTTGGGTCSPTNLLACARRGCSLRTAFELSACGAEKEVAPSLSGTNASTCSLRPGRSENEGAFSVAKCCGQELEIEQGISVSCPGMPTIRWSPEVECHNSAAFNWCGDSISPRTCVAKNDVPFDFGSMLPASFSQPLTTTPPRNSFYAMRVFDPGAAGRGIYNNRTATQAQAFDVAHLTSVALPAVNPYVATVPPVPSTAGWRVDYGLPTPPGHALGAGYDTLNERTATTSTVVSGCTIWNTFTPSSAATACASLPASTSTLYQLDLLTGGQCYDPGAGAYLAAVQDSATSVPPAPPQMAVIVTPSLAVPINVVKLPRAGGAPSMQSIDSNNEALRMIQSLEVPRSLHACRHATSQAEAAAFCPTR